MIEFVTLLIGLVRAARGWTRISAILVLLCGGATYAQAQAVSCESMSLDPVVSDASSPEGLGILDRYYVSAEGGSGVACWVHPHPNGRDFVITPPSWGQAPKPEQQGWIDLTMKVITDSRTALTPIGPLDSSLYILLTDLTAAESGRSGIAEAYWLLDSDCWVEARQDSRSNPLGGVSAVDSFKFTVAHEIGHCFLMENIPNYVPQTAWILTVKWWDESGAEYLAAQVYPRLDREHYRASAFDMDGSRWLQPYNSYVVLQHYANIHSPKAVIDLLTWFHEEGKTVEIEDVRRLFDAIYAHPTFGDFYHDFVVTHYQSLVEDAGGGTIPSELYVENYLEQMMIPESGKIPIPMAPANRLVLVELTIPDTYDLRLAPPTGSDKRHFETLKANEDFTRDWAREVNVEGSCEDNTQVQVLLTHHYETEISGLEIEYWLDKKCPCGDEELTDCCMKPRTSDLQPAHDHRPYYKGPDPIQSWGACMKECEDECWCLRKYMWSFEPTSLAECNQYWPGGTAKPHPSLLSPCEGMTDPRNPRPTARKDVLATYCSLTVCAQKCGPMPAG